MIRGSDTPYPSRRHRLPSEAKFVDKTEPAQGISHLRADGEASRQRVIWLRPDPARAVLAKIGFFGSRQLKEALWADLSRSEIERGDELAARFNEQERLRTAATLSYADPRAAGAREIERQLGELDEEETSPRRVADHLPEALAAFLRAMPLARRREREQAIIDKIGWEGVNLLDLDPRALAASAETRARQYAESHPKNDERFQSPEHRRLREPKTWRRRLTKQARKARAYIEGAVGAVGGPERPGRPLYVSDYTMRCHRADLRQGREHMERLRIVKLDDPTVQIPLIEAHQRKLEKEAAKRRLMLDVHIARAEAIGARTVWTTLTLPGAFHPHASNEGKRADAWNPGLGPDEAMQEMQKLFHQTMCLIRERGARPWGFWDAQAQQDGTPHRHLPAFVHDRGMTPEEAAALADPDTPDEVAARIRADSDDRVLQEARTVADQFWRRFSSTPDSARQDEARRADHGCRAYVIGDADPRYAPPRDRNGNEETCASIAKYTARYATRLATGAMDLHEVAGVEGSVAGAAEDRPASDLERHAAWATSRRARLHNWIGVASNRAPSKLWDAVWNAARRGEVTDDPRMQLAVIHMIDAQNDLAEVSRVRTELREMESEPPGDERDDRIRRLKDEVKGHSTAAAWSAYHACIAMGVWPDRDLHASERLWLREELGVVSGERLPLPPVPVREDRQNVFEETVRETVGVAAPVIVMIGSADDTRPKRKDLEPGQMVMDTEDGGWALVTASDDPLKRIILRDESWTIVDRDAAMEMAREARERKQRTEGTRSEDHDRHRAMQAAYREIREVDVTVTSGDVKDTVGTVPATPAAPLSLIPTDPRIGATPLPRVLKPGDDPPIEGDAETPDRMASYTTPGPKARLRPPQVGLSPPQGRPRCVRIVPAAPALTGRVKGME
uniref:Replication endonuclease n=1 Tax=Bosea sp. NBC_00436 TaxID=2969620 RepID=A0A9E7ZZI8_9HYPH